MSIRKRTPPRALNRVTARTLATSALTTPIGSPQWTHSSSKPRALPEQRFVLAGSGYPEDFPWTPNIWFVRHLPPAEHPAFYAASRLTLNVTRADMAAYGWCPSGRLFEAAACGAPILTDTWEGLDAFFTPGEELLTAATTADALSALARDDLPEIAQRARARALAEHTSAHRSDELLALLECVPA